MNPSFEQMQAAELAWWRGFLSQPHALSRLFAIYGYRYLPFFFEEFGHLGAVVDFGSGPVSAAYIGEPAPAMVYCVDPLLEAFQDAGLLYNRPIIVKWPSPPSPLALIVPAMFDTALVLNVLDHADDPAALICAVGTSLRSNGAALVWNHVDAIPDALHRAVTTAQIRSWLLDAGLAVMRERTFTDYGPQAYMAVAVRP